METLLLSALGLSTVFAILAVVMTSDEGCPSSNALRQMAVWIIGVTGSSSFSLCGFLLMLQATFLDCVPFGPFSFQQDGLTASGTQP